MADNYLEKRYDEVFNSRKTKIKRIGHPVDDLLLRNRSYRGYYKDFVVSEEMLRRIVSVNSRIPSARNQQVLRFRLVTKGAEAEAVLANIRLGNAHPEWHLPLPGTEPEAFIIVCSCQPESRLVSIDLGISLQSMLLKAVEMGLGGIIVQAFNKVRISQALQLPYEPLVVLAIGKPAERVELVPIRENESHAYYRENGIHRVPKIPADQLIIEPVVKNDE